MAEVNGTLNSETLAGTENSDLIRGFAGDDTINGVDGSDEIYAGEGNDNITVGDGASTVYGGAGNDTIEAGDGASTISGGAGDDLITVNSFTAGTVGYTQAEQDADRASLDAVAATAAANVATATTDRDAAVNAANTAEATVQTAVNAYNAEQGNPTPSYVAATSTGAGDTASIATAAQADAQSKVDDLEAATTARDDAQTALSDAASAISFYGTYTEVMAIASGEEASGVLTQGDAAELINTYYDADVALNGGTERGAMETAVVYTQDDPGATPAITAGDSVGVAPSGATIDGAAEDLTAATTAAAGAQDLLDALGGDNTTDALPTLLQENTDLATAIANFNTATTAQTNADAAVSAFNTANPVVAADEGTAIDGGDGDDTLVIDVLQDGDVITDGEAQSVVSGVAGVTVENIETIIMSGLGDYELDLSADASFTTLSTSLTTSGVDDNVSDDIQLIGYDADTGAISNIDSDGGTDAEDPGIVIDGTRYVDGDELATAAGGIVAVSLSGGNYDLDYTAPGDGDIAVLNAGTLGADATADETLMVTITDVNGNEVETEVVLSYGFGANINIGETAPGAGDAWTNSTRINGDATNNVLTSGEGNDTIIGGDGNDTITLNGGNNVSYAGAGDTGNDKVYINGDGNNIVGAGDGTDQVYINGDGANTVFLSLGGDYAEIQGDGDNVIWSGADDADDVIIIGDGTDDGVNDGDGNNVIGLGAGSDYAEINGDGDNVAYGAAGDDVIGVNGDGDNTVYGGADATASNTINVNGEGDNTIYNGAGDDFVNVAATATGANTFYGGAGDDTFVFADGAAGTLIFEAGQGNDTVDAGSNGAALLDDDALMIDLAAFGYADGDAVLADMANDTVGGQNGVLLTLSAGQTIFFDGADLTDFQQATVSDWAIL
jgi:hypothetical protein